MTTETEELLRRLTRVLDDFSARGRTPECVSRLLANSGFVAEEAIETPVDHSELIPRDIAREDIADFSSAVTPDRIPFELRLVELKAKPLTLLTGRQDWVRSLGCWATSRGLFALLTPFYYRLQSDVSKGGYSNLHQISLQPCTDARRSILIGETADLVGLAWLAATFRWDAGLGSLLGYPSCCVRWFGENWARAAKDLGGDLARMTIDASVGYSFDWRLNIFARYFGEAIIQHFPCSLACQSSKRRAAAVQNVLMQSAPDEFDYLPSMHQGAVIYTESAGIAMARDCYIQCERTEWMLAYEPGNVRCTANSALTELVLSRAMLCGPIREGRLFLDDTDRGYLLQFD